MVTVTVSVTFFFKILSFSLKQNGTLMPYIGGTFIQLLKIEKSKM